MVFCARTNGSGIKMLFVVFTILCSARVLANGNSNEFQATEMLANILSQFLASASTERETTTSSSGLLPKILNPLHWIPNFADIPYNPDSELTTVEIATRHGYLAESHTVVTEDGYILNLHRILCGRAGCGDGVRPPVFLQHGILASSADWVLSGPDKALAFLLADLGWDVWLGNERERLNHSKFKIKFLLKFKATREETHTVVIT